MRVKDLEKFEKEYDTSREDSALRTRGVFITRFPLQSLREMTIDDYVIGHGKPSFCYLVESGTKSWANIQGATSFKFGIYFGKTKSDPAQKYRFAARFGTSKDDAFSSVKAALLDLVALGAEDSPDFTAIDANPLSQMLKAKILSLYYPERFLAMCSSEHLKMMAEIFKYPKDLAFSQYQSLLLETKQGNSTTRSWSEPKFMAYLYQVYVWGELGAEQSVERPRIRKHRQVDFEELLRHRSEIGLVAEEYALQWERERLAGARLEHLIDKIEDRRSRPGYGHDFLSYSSDSEHRFIEVKCVAKLKDEYRFFLSENEHQTSLSPEHCTGYYFYLVFFDGNRNPVKVHATVAAQLYPKAVMLPAAYEVRVHGKEFAKRGEAPK